MAIASRQTPLYQAAAEVFVNPNAQITGAGGASADAQARFLATEAKLVDSRAVAAIALRRSPVPGTTAGDLLRDSSISADPTTNIITFTVKSRSRAVATTLANAFANAATDHIQQFASDNFQRAIVETNRSIGSMNKRVDAARRAGPVPVSLLHQLDTLLRLQQTLEQQKLTQPILATVSKPASGATQTQPNVRRSALLGLLLGLVLGVIIAFVRDALHTGVNTSSEVAERLGLPLLARIPTPPRALRKADQLAMVSDKAGEHGEAYRKLRVAVDMARLTHPSKTVMLTSAVEKEGKSTTAANLAVAMARTGRRVALIDLDLRRPYIDRFFGLNGRPGLTDLVLGRTPLETALAPVVVATNAQKTKRATESNGHPERPGAILHVLPAGASLADPSEFLESDALRDTIKLIAERFDIVLIDSPPLLPVSDALSIARLVDAMIVVTHLSLVRRPLLDELRRLLETCPTDKLGFVLTAAESERSYGYGYGYGYADAESRSVESTQSG